MARPDNPVASQTELSALFLHTTEKQPSHRAVERGQSLTTSLAQAAVTFEDANSFGTRASSTNIERSSTNNT
jgi:hypothetical protein